MVKVFLLLLSVPIIQGATQWLPNHCLPDPFAARENLIFQPNTCTSSSWGTGRLTIVGRPWVSHASGEGTRPHPAALRNAHTVLPNATGGKACGMRCCNLGQRF